MILTYPKVKFYWHNANRGICGIEDEITDFKTGKYGYKLEAGQRIYRISYTFYEGTHCRVKLCYGASIVKVSDEGILIDKWLEQGWNTDQFKPFYQEDGKALLPWKYKDADIEIEPCVSLYENYKGSDLISGKCHFHRLGGYRVHPIYEEYGVNLQNIEVMGQYELSFEEGADNES